MISSFLFLFYMDTSRVSLIFFCMFLSVFAFGNGIISQWISDLPVALPAAARAHVIWHLAAAVASVFAPTELVQLWKWHTWSPKHPQQPRGRLAFCTSVGHMVLPSKKVPSVPPTVSYLNFAIYVSKSSAIFWGISNSFGAFSHRFRDAAAVRPHAILQCTSVLGSRL